MTSRPTDAKIGDLLDVEIVKIVPRGLGLAFAAGSAVFVPLAASGDRLAVRVREIKGGSIFAEIQEVLSPSPQRIKPPCLYFGACGGCDFQQLEYSSQLASKAEIIRDCLVRIGKVDLACEIEIVASPLEFGYRTRAQWHVDPTAKTIGYYRRLSHDVIDIEHCPIASHELNETLAELRRTLDWQSISAKRIAIDAAAGDDGSVSLHSSGISLNTAEIVSAIAGEYLTFSAKSFFQGNRSIIERLIDAALDGASGGCALDLYSGVGLFTLPLARRFQRVTAVEDNRDAVALARLNAKRGGLSNIEFVRGKVANLVKSAAAGSADFILLDPPRAGGSKETIKNIARIGPSAISYVSCEPSILARDLRWLIDLGFGIDRIIALDMFPQTHHVETVAHLSRIG